MTKSEMNWTTDKPTQPGYYWFYGWLWGKDRLHNEPPRFEQVIVKQVANGMVYIGCGTFVAKRDCVGVWQSMPVPAIPDVGEFPILV